MGASPEEHLVCPQNRARKPVVPARRAFLVGGGHEVVAMRLPRPPMRRGPRAGRGGR